MANNISFAEVDKRDAFDTRKDVPRPNQPGHLSKRQVNLRNVSRNDRLAAETDSREEHFHLLRGRVLCLIENDERIVQGSPTHKRDRSNLDHTSLQMPIDTLDIKHVIKRVIQWFQIRIDLLLQSPWKKPKPLAGFNCGAGQNNPADFLLQQALHSHADSQVSFAGARRTDTENHVVLFNRLEVELLIERFRRDVPFSGLQRLRAGYHSPQTLCRVLGNDANDRFQIAVGELHPFRTKLRVIFHEAFDEFDIVIVPINGQIVLVVDVNLNFQEGFEVFDVTVVRSKKLGDPVADPNAFLHP